MTGFLTTEGIVQSRYVPHVSRQPFSEAQFKTMKYDLDYPRRFTDIDHARTWVARFTHTDNTVHRHSGVGYCTPQSVHDGTWTTLRNRRQDLLDHAWRQHPTRFWRRPKHTASMTLPGSTNPPNPPDSQCLIQVDNFRSDRKNLQNGRICSYVDQKKGDGERRDYQRHPDDGNPPPPTALLDAGC